MPALDWSADFWLWLGSVLLRLLLAVILGGLIGYEREHASRPAGFRTHILVCLGSALVMILAEFLSVRYQGQITVDPTRMGAQVISGIGFLGAGTIIRNGSSVKGLTTAASLWAVSCVGLACGGGFYLGAVLATLFIFVTLITLKRLEKSKPYRTGDASLQIQLTHYCDDVLQILQLAGDMKLSVHKLQIVPEESDIGSATGVRLRLDLTRVSEADKVRLILAIQKLPSIQSITDE